MSNEDRLTLHPESFKLVQQEMSDFGIIRTCANCTNVDLDNNVCKLYNATPPIKVISEGCDKWLIKLPF